MTPQKKKFIAAIVLIVLGIGFIGLTFLPGNAERQESVKAWNEAKEAGSEAKGVLTTSEAESQRNGRRHVMTYCGVYEFRVGDATHTARAVGDDCVRDRSELAEGSTVTVVYNPENPSQAFVQSDATETFYSDRKDSQFVGLIFGVPMVLIGGIIAYVNRPKRASMSNGNL